jgi:hypothetical protein
MPSDLARLILSSRAPRCRNNQVPLPPGHGEYRETVWKVRDWIKGRIGQTGAIIRGRHVLVSVEQPSWREKQELTAWPRGGSVFESC